jgi:hypothetical protein
LLQPHHPHPISPSRGNIPSGYPPGTLLRARETRVDAIIRSFLIEEKQKITRGRLE